MISIRAGALEQFVIDQLKVLAQDKSLVQDIVHDALKESSDEIPAKRQERAQTTIELGKIEGEIKNWMDIMGEEGTASPRKGLILERMGQLGIKREELKRKLLAYENEIVELESRRVDAEVYQRNLSAFIEVFERLEPKQKKEFIRLLVREVIFDRTNSRIRLALASFEGFEWTSGRFPLSFETSTKWLAGWDDFRTGHWISIVEFPEVTAQQVKQLLAIAV
jgi:site-specific DNA recombinase